MKDFKGKTAVVTGAARGIGLSICKELAKRGANIVMADIDYDKLLESENEIKNIGAKTSAIRVDVTEYDDIAKMKNEALEKFGTVELLFNNAGVTALGDIVHMPIVDFDFCVKTNLYSTYYGMREFIPQMLKQKNECHIANTCSLAGLYTDPGMPAYYAAKHAVIGLSEAVYRDFITYGANIGLTILCPGMVRTDIASCDDRRPEKFKVDKSNPYYSSEVYLSAKQTSYRNTTVAGQDPDEVAEILFDAIEHNRLYAVCRKQLVEHIYERYLVAKDEAEFYPGWHRHVSQEKK